MPSVIRFISLSNLLSYLSLASGLLAISFAAQGNPTVVGLFFALTSFFDLLDGKFANLFSRTEYEKSFGVQLDSLVDCAVFGITPIVALGALFGMASPKWMLFAFPYSLSAITRLGFYNVFNSDGKYLVGMPTTLCNLVWSAMLTIPTTASRWMEITSLVLAVLMLAPVRYPKPKMKGVLVIACAALVILFFHAQRLWHD